MKTWFVDSNVLLRFFTSDDEGQSEKAAKLLRCAAEGTIHLVCGPPVLFEVAWTLRTVYRVPRDRVLSAIQALFALPGLEFTDAAIVGPALTSASSTGVDFADTYIAASARAAGCDGVATFNRKDFGRLGLRTADL
jgi:predicted nucleic acid-binding protein